MPRSMSSISLEVHPDHKRSVMAACLVCQGEGYEVATLAFSAAENAEVFALWKACLAKLAADAVEKITGEKVAACIEVSTVDRN